MIIIPIDYFHSLRNDSREKAHVWLKMLYQFNLSSHPNQTRYFPLFSLPWYWDLPQWMAHQNAVKFHPPPQLCPAIYFPNRVFGSDSIAVSLFTNRKTISSYLLPNVSICSWIFPNISNPLPTHHQHQISNGSFSMCSNIIEWSSVFLNVPNNSDWCPSNKSW